MYRLEAEEMKAIETENKALRTALEKMEKGYVSQQQKESVMSFAREYGALMFELGQTEDKAEQDKILFRASNKIGFIDVILMQE